MIALFSFAITGREVQVDLFFFATFTVDIMRGNLFAVPGEEVLSCPMTTPSEWEIA
jgi:hypothetical protein